MKRSLLFLVAALVASASLCAAQPRTAAKTESSGGGVGQTFKDSWITSKTKMALIKDRRVKARHVTVETHSGVVALRGKVGSMEQRTVAEEIAKGLDGVKRVNNVLQVVPDKQRDAVDARDAAITKAVQQRLAADGRLEAMGIDVRADNGMVTLTGTVPDAQTRARAGDVVRKVPGVRSVRNELDQKS